MKRFWSEVALAESDSGWTIALDGRPVRTPARAPLSLPTLGLAEAIAEEWRAQWETVDPRSMPLTGLANAAIDRVAADPARFAADLARYAEGDLLCYRAQGPEGLIARQSEAWDPLLAWARARFDIDFVTTSGVVHVAQPPATVRCLSDAVAAIDPFHLVALSPLVTIGGSLVAALAVVEGERSAEQAWTAVSVDDGWQLERWGRDEEAVKALDLRRAYFLAAARFLALLD